MTTHVAPARTIHSSSNTDRTNVAFVANRKGLAVAVHNAEGPSAIEIIKLPHLPGAALVPKTLFGIAVEELNHIAQTEAPAKGGDLHASALWLMELLVLIAKPSKHEDQARRVKNIADNTGRTLRHEFEKMRRSKLGAPGASGIISYLTDRHWENCGKRQPWTLRNVLPDNALREMYGQIVLSSLHRAFEGYNLHENDQSKLEQYIYYVLREHSSAEKRLVTIFGLTGSEAKPAIGEFEVDGFVGDRLKLELEPWEPRVLDYPTGLIETFSLSPVLSSGARFDRSKRANSLLTRRFQSAIDRNGEKAICSVLNPRALSVLAAEVYHKRHAQVVWAEGHEHFDPAPPAFDMASPPELLEIARFLAKSLSDVEGFASHSSSPSQCLVLGAH